MSRLFLLILTISMGSCAGAGVIAALTMGYYTWQAILLSGGIGAAVGIGVAWYVARILHGREAEHHPADPEGRHPDNPYGVPKKPRPPH